MYGKALKLGLKNIRNTDNEDEYEIWAEDVKKEISERFPVLNFIVSIGLLVILASGVGVWYGVIIPYCNAAIRGAPMDFWLAILLIWLLSKLQ